MHGPGAVTPGGWEGNSPLAPQPGSYVVLLQSTSAAEIAIGRLGPLALGRGVYLYVGSARGPGGVAARCAHHLRIAVSPRWHLDYLRPYCRIRGFWVAYGDAIREHDWARALADLPGATLPLARFGASDCCCPAHLIRFAREPARRVLSAALKPAQRVAVPEDSGARRRADRRGCRRVADQPSGS